jgi:hypothetical protein
VLDTAKGGVATVGIFSDLAGAEESTRRAAKWLAENDMARFVPNAPTSIQGAVAVSAAR